MTRRTKIDGNLLIAGESPYRIPSWIPFTSSYSRRIYMTSSLRPRPAVPCLEARHEWTERNLFEILLKREDDDFTPDSNQ